MDYNNPEFIEKIRKQFDNAPYPRKALNEYPSDVKFLYIHSFVTSYYLRNKKVISTEGKVILDAGCGSGYKALGLAIANPGAKIVGIDLSEESVKLARQRLQYYGFNNTEFHTLTIEELPQLGMEFDYINNDEVLYLVPDAIAALQAMKSVLKPNGLIRTNLHSSLQRANYFRAQQVFKMMGLMDENPTELEIDLVRQTMKALKDHILLKTTTWRPEYEDQDDWFLANYLLQGDKGYTIPEMFSALRAADLEFISMVKWAHWNVVDVFNDPENLPVFLGMSLPELSVEERLHLYEMLHPAHRLLDFWCGHPNAANESVSIDEWTMTDWQGVQVHIHPQLTTPAIKEEMLACINNFRLMEIAKYLPFTLESVLFIDSSVVACILPLLEGAQPMPSLVERWKQIRPLNPATLQPIDEAAAFETLKPMLMTLERLGFVLLERSLSDK